MDQCPGAAKAGRLHGCLAPQIVPRLRLPKHVWGAPRLSDVVTPALKTRGARAIEIGLAALSGSGSAATHGIKPGLCDSEAVAVVLIACLLIEALSVSRRGSETDTSARRGVRHLLGRSARSDSG